MFSVKTSYIYDNEEENLEIIKALKLNYKGIKNYFNLRQASLNLHFDIFSKDKPDLLIINISKNFEAFSDLIARLKKVDYEIFLIFIIEKDFDKSIEMIDEISIFNIYLVKPIKIEVLLHNIRMLNNIIAKNKLYATRFNFARQYENIINHTAIVSKVNTKGIITYVNRAFCDISGYTEDELVGSSYKIVKDPQVSSEVYEKLWKTIEAKIIFKYPSLSHVAKDGSRYYVDTTVVPILDDKKEIKEYISVKFDTTDIHKSLQEEIKAKETQSRFLANMSHEIRTPLNAILGFSKILEKSKNISYEEKDYLNTISSNVEVLLSKISEILDISKIQSGKMELDNVEFNPHKEFTSIKKLFQAKADEKNIDYRFSIPEQLNNIVCHGDLTKIKQVLSNLLSNALKFTDTNGRVIFNIEFSKKSNDIVLIHFTIKDDGIGISEDGLKVIFKPFVQEKTSNYYGGTGLGLSIVKEFVNLMGGKINVISKLNIGTKFDMELELKYSYSQIENQSKEVLDTKDIILNDKQSILVVDDVKINQKLINILLNQKGFSTICADDGLDAIEMYKKNKNQISMILMDINMPNMDGIESMKEINKLISLENMKKIPIIALTANAINGDEKRFLNEGFDGYLTKPISENKLDNIIYNILKAENKKNIDIDENAKKMSIPGELYLELLKEFLQSIDSEVEELGAFIANQERKKVLEQAHKLKGLSLNLRLENLSKLFLMFEDKESNFENLLNKVLAEVSIIKVSLEN